MEIGNIGNIEIVVEEDRYITYLSKKKYFNVEIEKQIFLVDSERQERILFSKKYQSRIIHNIEDIPRRVSELVGDLEKWELSERMKANEILNLLKDWDIYGFVAEVE